MQFEWEVIGMDYLLLQGVITKEQLNDLNYQWWTDLGLAETSTDFGTYLNLSLNPH